MSTQEKRLTITIRSETQETQRVSALWLQPAGANTCLVLAHGAGAGMDHPFMQALAGGLAEQGVATLRYQFPYMERGSRRVDSPAVAHAAVRAAVAEARRRMPAALMLAGGKSFGARMTSQAQAETGLTDVAGLVFVGFPLHPAGAPARSRAVHLAQVHLPMLFLQGTRDALAENELVQAVTQDLDRFAWLRLFADADHSFHVRRSSGSSDSEVMDGLIDAICTWAAMLSVQAYRH